jgi:hypothetical protein
MEVGYQGKRAAALPRAVIEDDRPGFRDRDRAPRDHPGQAVKLSARKRRLVADKPQFSWSGGPATTLEPGQPGIRQPSGHHKSRDTGKPRDTGRRFGGDAGGRGGGRRFHDAAARRRSAFPGASPRIPWPGTPRCAYRSGALGENAGDCGRDAIFGDALDYSAVVGGPLGEEGDDVVLGGVMVRAQVLT